MSSIFQAGGALPAGYPAYVERQADHDALRVALNGEYLHVIAPRQVGKTSLLKRLAARLGEMGWHCAYVDLATLIDLPKPVWYAELGKSLARDLTPGQTPSLSNQVDLRTYLLDQAFPCSDSQPCIALFLDEVEGAGKARDADGESFSDTFFSMFRALYNERDKLNGTLVIALAGAVNPNDLVRDPDISPFNVGQEISLDDFTPAETRALTEHLVNLGLPVEESVHQAIYNWTNGHPYLTQRICAELERAARSGGLTAITPDSVEHIVEQTILNPTNPLQRDKNLRHVAKMLERLSTPATELWSRLRVGESVSYREATDDLFLELYLTGAVKTQAGRLTFRNRIYTSAFGQREEAQIELNYEAYAQRLLMAFYEAHQDPQYAGVRAHGLPGIVLATGAGIVSADEWKAKDYWTSPKRWDTVAALRELMDRGYIKRTEDDTEEHAHPDDWNFRLTPEGKSAARELLGQGGEIDLVPSEQVGLPRPTRIFVSSTWQNLHPEREAVETALHRMQDAAFAGMEYFGSRPETPKDVSLTEVDRSDVYIGIFAHRYGSGITEAEYRRARKRRIPCLIYLKDDSVPVVPAHIERDPDKITELEALKRELKQHHTVSPFHSPDHLATQVITDLHNLLGSTVSGEEREASQHAPKYQITITGSQGIVIGDQAQVSQQFGTTSRQGLKPILRNQVAEGEKEWIQVLVASAWPDSASSGNPEVNGEVTRQIISAALHASGAEFRVDLLQQATRQFLLNALLNRYQILHLIANVAPNGTVVLADGPLSPDAFQYLLKDKDLKILILSSCNSVSVVSALREAQVPALIAATYSLRVDVANRFDAVFYESLGSGKLVSEAFRLAQEMIRIEFSHEPKMEFLVRPVSVLFLDLREDFGLCGSVGGKKS